MKNSDKQWKILLLEDDKDLRETLTEELQEAGYSITATNSSEEVIELTYEKKFHLYLFDVNVIGMNGFKLLTLLRQAGDQTPAIFLTSKNRIPDLKEGFQSGADDYIKKPFDMDELLIRIERFVIRDETIFIDNHLSFNPQTHTLLLDEETIELHAKESQILYYFLSRPNQIVSKEEVIEALYEDAQAISDATFRVYIKNIKKAARRELLKNVRSQGYIFEKA